ncbi:MAG: zinc metallopeptidase [Gaiellaceae bacterium]
MPSLQYVALAIVPIGLGFAARFWVSAAFRAAGRVQAVSGVTGSEAALQLLTANGCADVSLETADGELTDHYDPGERVIRLSQEVGEESSVGALAVVAHEVGHVLQDREGDRAFRVQRAIVPVASFCSYGWLAAIAAGLFLESAGLVAAALALFAAVALFHVATLPVELGASRRALSLLATQQLLTVEELPVARRVLRAAAGTYLVAALVAITEALRLALELALAGEE